MFSELPSIRYNKDGLFHWLMKLSFRILIQPLLTPGEYSKSMLQLQIILKESGIKNTDFTEDFIRGTFQYDTGYRIIEIVVYHDLYE
jgi:hypothetical protein